MSKHLRFGKLLSLLAILLTLSVAWNSVSAQNQSSLKQVATYSVATQVGTTAIDNTAKTLAFTVPYGTNLTALATTFTVSPFAKMYWGKQTAGAFVSGDLMTSGGARNYSNGISNFVPGTSLFVTVEAENHSFDYYAITVSIVPPLTDCNISVFSADYRKMKGLCLAGFTIGTGTNVTFGASNAISVTVPYGAILDDMTVNYTASTGATGSPASGTAVDFDTDVINDGIPNAVSFTITAQDGTTTKTYTVLPVVSAPSVLSDLTSLTFDKTVSGQPAGFTQLVSVTMNAATRVADVVVNYWNVADPLKGTLAQLIPTFVVSPYATSYKDEPLTSLMCSGVTAGGGATFKIYTIAEDRHAQITTWTVNITQAPARTGKDITAMVANYTKTWGTCSPTLSFSENVVGQINNTLNTITFSVPAGVLSVSVGSSLTGTVITPSDGAVVVPATGSYSDGTTIAVTSESLVARTYTVKLVNSAASGLKQMLTFGFKSADNAGLGIVADRAGVITQNTPTTTGKIAVSVPWNTDVYRLVPYFTSSNFSTVYIIESPLTSPIYTTQCSRVTGNDYSNTLTYVVRAADGTEDRYEVIVTKENALTGNDLIGFKLTELPYCFGGYFETSGTYTGTNIAVSVKYGTTLTSRSYSFTVSPGATVTPAATGSANFSSPVTFTVTSQSGVSQTYTVTVTPRAENSEKKLLTYWFDADDNSSLGVDAVGTVNEAAKTVEVWIPWDARTYITALKARFTLSTNALMTHSEDTQVLQVSGSSANDFTTPVAYTVWAENCTSVESVEYFVTVKVVPNVNTGISAFTFTTSGCGCDLVNKIDPYARRIYITLPYTMNIANLAPYSVVVTPGASVVVANTDPAQPWSTAKNWTSGPVTYTVTAPDGVTKANWTVVVTNPPCTEHNIISFSLPYAQVSSSDLVAGHGVPVVIDTLNHTIDVIIKKGTNLSRIYYERELSCGATICCVGGNCEDNHYLDFSENGCHTCIVTAEDQTVKQDWTICVHEIDVAIPLVTTWSVMAYNCTDSVAVQTNEKGRVFIVNELALNKTVSPWVPSGYNLFDWTGTTSVSSSVASLVANRMGNWAAVSAGQVDTPVYVKTNGLYSGTYWAFAVDDYGRISCISDQKLYLDICEVDVATLCDLRGQPDVWRYRLTGEVFVTYEETRSGGNWKFVQDATCGILIEDRLGALPLTPYGEGAGITNLLGTLILDPVQMRFIPVCCYTPTKSSTGNVVTPMDLTYDEFKSQCYTTRTKYESMLVRVTTPMIAFDDYHGDLNWMYDNLDLATINAKGAYDRFIQSVFNSPLIGTVIPTAPAYYTGVRTNVNRGSIYGLFTPRKAADITLVSGPIITAKPNPATVEGVLPGQCKSVNITIYNEGATLGTVSGVANITALYLDDSPASDEFNLVTPPAVPFTIGTWTSKQVTVAFCPLNIGDESTNLVVEYGVGKTLVVPINGKTAVINAMPSCQDFNPPHPGGSDFGAAYMGWQHPEDNTTYLQNYVHNAWVSYDGSAVLNMRPRKQVAGVRQTTWMVSPGFAITGTDPVITWAETAATVVVTGIPKNSPRNLYVSTNGTTWALVDSYNTNSMPDAMLGGGWRTKTYSLAAYVGQTIWWKWELPSVAHEYTYWCLDNICVQERITTPIISASPNPGDFGGVQVDAVGTINFSIKNLGVSVLKIKAVSVSGAGFTLTDTNTYPVEVYDGPGTWAYTVGNAGSELTFSVDFKPTDIGVKTGTIVITYGLYSDMTYEIPLTGEGLSCYTAAVAVKGQNYAPSQNTWFQYTADKFSIVQVTSCDAHQDLVTNEYAWDTWIYVYSDCAGTLIAENDDMEGACVYNRASSSVQTVVNSGETIYIFWPLAFPTALHAYDGFYFNVNVTYPIDGDVCENAIPLTLPVVNHFGTTVGFNDDYDSSPCSPFSNYMDGNDKVYTITLPYEGYLTASILGAYGSIHVLDLCPTVELEKFHCKAFASGPNGGPFDKKIAAGTYFVIISTWAPPQTVDYLLNMSFRGTGVDNSELMSNLSVYPNPTSGKFTVSISNAEATDMTLELVNISGQVVYRNEVKAAYIYNEDIDASRFAKGVYYLKVNSAKGVEVEKVVVQ